MKTHRRKVFTMIVNCIKLNTRLSSAHVFQFYEKKTLSASFPFVSKNWETEMNIFEKYEYEAVSIKTFFVVFSFE